MAQLEVVILNLTLLLFPGHRPGPEEGTLGPGTRLRKLLWAPPRPAPGPPGAHLEEDGRVLLVDPHQLHVGHGVDAAHGQAGQRHDGGQHLHVPAEGDGGEHQGDGQGGGEESPQRLGQAAGRGVRSVDGARALRVRTPNPIYSSTRWVGPQGSRDIPLIPWSEGEGSCGALSLISYRLWARCLGLLQ